MIPKSKTVRSLLSSKKRWIKGTWGRDKNGSEVTATSPSACQFCLSGAIRRVYINLNEQREASTKLERVIQAYSLDKTIKIWMFNDADETTFKDIQRVVRLADI